MFPLFPHSVYSSRAVEKLYRRYFGGESLNRRRQSGTSLVETRSDARLSKRGTSLVETLVSMTLLGVIFIPMLFLSSAFFLTQLAKSRQNVDVSVNAARFANQFMEELNLTQRVLPESTTTEIRFSYYDPIRQVPVKRGYRLSDSGSYRILEKMVYNSSTESWTAQSPYGSAAANQVLLPATAVFDYCDTLGCGLSAKNAVFVRLNNWEFMPRKNVSRRVDFPTLDVHLSAGASAGGITLAQAPQELYSFAKAASFGSSTDLKLINLNPTGSMFNYAYVQSGDSGTLTTIVTNVQNPGVDGSAEVSPIDGRVYIGSAGGSVYWTWHKNTGLTTISSSLGSPADYHGHAVSPFDGRVVLGDGSGRVVTWQETTGLSTIVTGLAFPGFDDSMKVGPNGRFYWGTGATQFYAWKAGTGADTGLSTIITGLSHPGSYGCMDVSPVDGRIFFGEETTTAHGFYTWLAGCAGNNCLSTLVSASSNNIGHDHATKAGSDGRIYFGESSATGTFWTWLGSTGLSTIVTGVNHPGAERGIRVSPTDGRVYFSTQGASSPFFTWIPGCTGGSCLSTLVVGNNPGNIGAMQVSPVDGRIYFGESNNPGSFYTWRQGSGLSTIVSAQNAPGDDFSVAVSPLDGRVFFNNDAGSSGKFWTWHSSTGLTTILTDYAHANINDNYDDRIVVSPIDGRAFWGKIGLPTSAYSWKSDTGLSTVLNGQEDVGIHGNILVSPLDGRLYIGSWAGGSSHYWTWSAVTPGTSINRVTTSGGKTNQALVVTPPSEYLSYNASYQDIDGELYMSDSLTKNVDRYGYSGSSFVRKSQFNWSANTGAVGAIAVDQAKTGIALLDVPNKQIDYYTNRKASGSVTAGSQLSLAATSSPTGLAVSGRTGNYLVLDSYQQGTNPNKYVRLFVYNESGTQVSGSPWKIYLSPGAASGFGLSVDATGESNFKLAYDDRKNVLYLIAPTVGRVYALMLPETF